MVMWQRGKLGDFLTLQRGFDLPAYERRPGNVPVITSSGISGFHDEARVLGPGVVMGRYGTIGEIFYIDEDFWPHNTSLYVKDFKGNKPKFVSYFLKTVHYEAHNDKSSVPGLNRNHLHLTDVVFPPLPEQHAIAAILGSLDDKIELNRKTNATLEELARTLFAAWFVEFAPVRAKAAGHVPQGIDAATAALFPDSFEDSPLGPVPQGWRVVEVDDLFEVSIGKTPPRNQHQWFSTFQEDVPWMSIKDLGNSGVFIIHTSEFLTSESVEKFRVKRISSGTVVLSFKLTVGRVAITDREMLSNEAIAHFTPRSQTTITNYYLYSYLKQFRFDSLGSTSSIATAVNSKSVRSIPILVPSNEIARQFSLVVTPLFHKIRLLQYESNYLTVLRDTLLPKLLSGELRVKDVEPLV